MLPPLPSLVYSLHLWVRFFFVTFSSSFCLLDSIFLRLTYGLPRRRSGKESACQCRRCRFDPWVRKILQSRKRKPAPGLLPGESHGQRSLAGYSPWGISFSIIPSKSTHIVANGKISFFFMAECSIVSVCVCVCVPALSFILYPLMDT